jgi:hypothetical protein
MKKIKSLIYSIIVEEKLLDSKNGEIIEFSKLVGNSSVRGTHYDDRDSNKETYALWYRQGNKEINSKYVIEINYEEFKND